MSIDVSTTSGRVRGVIEDDISVFRGIPFAAEPYGANRFRAPQPPPPWDGVRDATAYGPGCPQPTLDPRADVDGWFNPPTQGHDCLTLNVWTPDPGRAGLPVMVWIHGGGYISGGGAARAHGGRTWAREGIVYVSINYRLNVDGFTYFPDRPAHRGMLDQIAALQWVHDNIANFGGDPDLVTVFGQSGGGVSVFNLMAMPAARGLFRRAIPQSGSTLSAAAPDLAWRITQRLAEILGVEPTAEAMATVPDDKLLAGAANLGFEYLSPGFWGDESFLISPFRTILDGETLPVDVEPAIAAGSAAGVDVMAGSTRDECTFAMEPLGMLNSVPVEWRDHALHAFKLTLEDLEVYRRASRPDADESELLMAAWTDCAFRMPTLRVLEHHSRQPGMTYAYEFAWPSPLPKIGAVHALELPFVDDVLAEQIAAFAGNLNPLGDNPPQVLADLMHGSWVRFVKTGDPGWPQYDTTDRITMRFDTESGPVSDLAGLERSIWKSPTAAV